MLELLDLRNNNLNGPIPLELTHSTSLKILLVYSNNNMVESSPIVCLNRRSQHCLKEYKRRLSLPRTSVHNIQVRIGSDRRRRILQQSNIASNVGQTPIPNQIVYVPISQSSGSFPAIPKTVNSNPMIGPTNNGSDQKRLVGGNTWKYVVAGVAFSMLIIVVAMIFISRSKAVTTIVPWKTGLSGQLQKAFVTGVPKLNRGELESACEEFSNIIDTNGSTLYKGTLSSGVEIAVTSTAITALKYWCKRSQRAYRKKIDMLSRINHKNFVNLIGYCEEDQPFTRMMVFEYAPNGSLSEHLHVKEVEHLDWGTRIRIIMGTSYCLHHMHDLSPPVAHPNLNANHIFLTDDYAAKIADIGFGQESSKNPGEDESEYSELTSSADPESNVYSFGIMLLEIISGKSPYDEGGSLSKWASECLNGKQNIKNVVDPTLKSFKNIELETVSDVIRMCGQSNSKKRPSMKEVIAKLKETIAITPDQAVPRLSPLWWAELEILSSESG
ncbi:protein MALE DISCOVERER 2-like isoform X2 [Impatiens glandulifera]|nr:protein MALE DISCOVERER 2-like isoform X2 [Impatiens glandulifera]